MKSGTFQQWLRSIPGRMTPLARATLLTVIALLALMIPGSCDRARDSFSQDDAARILA